MSLIKIATRKSPLALWQAEHVAKLLKASHPSLEIELVKMVTQGDKILDTPLAKIGGKGLFIKELEQGMLNGDADLAVHSMKDVPAQVPEGFEIGAILSREDPRDAFVSNAYSSINDLPLGAVVGTSSLRRQSQLLKMRPDLHIKSLRGNVNSRLQKLDNGDYDAIILAAAGLIRLGFENRIKMALPVNTLLAAIGQGAIGIECRQGDTATLALIECLHDKPTAIRVQAERAMNFTLEGGCQAPIAGHARIKGDILRLHGLVAEPDGSVMITEQLEGPLEDAEKIGVTVANRLLAAGAKEILDKLYDHAE
ncbi:MAG: hydroxymethylbilane synthase [Cycloclasticus pugetii]|jgi:hydroxymethylbilane synthase|uniref:Porphobilinogen deaminase n=1 Tax=Cycloclasticus zancles 78-ME TaxID=1198232 RepID=S5T518_9GAMM|nr:MULTISPECIES: hydroxymethylbilane synthase [Cycloclasticus]AGS38684.1 Porphobilinogen deaminase [Cycloclasticus zancles 78-ME]MBV1898155.1 hydroxymethylbilane synthase [Cycloclasticus sp.]PHR50710.1 MAG: hydroxymethylbilane synthase [Cycloclasticus sp.]